MKNISKVMTMAVLAVSVPLSAMADTGQHPEESQTDTTSQMPMTSGQNPMMSNQQGNMPMMSNQQGNMPMMGGNMDSMPMMKMMQERHAMMQAHMVRMETHMANIEALLGQLVELQKK